MKLIIIPYSGYIISRGRGGGGGGGVASKASTYISFAGFILAKTVKIATPTISLDPRLPLLRVRKKGAWGRGYTHYVIINMYGWLNFRH